MTWHRVAATAEVSPGRTLRVLAGDTEALVCNVGGRLHAIEDVCTHDGGPLDQGTLQGACIECPRHGATFDVVTGAALTLPAVVGLRTYPVEERPDGIYVDV